MIVVMVQAAVMLALPAIAGSLPARTHVLLDVALLVLLIGPAIHWRCMVNAGQTSSPRAARPHG